MSQSSRSPKDLSGESRALICVFTDVWPLSEGPIGGWVPRVEFGRTRTRHRYRPGTEGGSSPGGLWAARAGRGGLGIHRRGRGRRTWRRGMKGEGGMGDDPEIPPGEGCRGLPRRRGRIGTTAGRPWGPRALV